ncbi:MAG: hypothetical protein K0R57_5263 [Paenibacillaceae bacterium]|jgi:hypothetical protein|nr:hypothetical protein [Paenibacillaceae bacterium]
MKKNTFTLIVFIVLGLLAGSIMSQLLADVEALSFLLRSSDISLNPAADLQAVSFDIEFEIRLNLISLLGVAGAIWVYRKL